MNKEAFINQCSIATGLTKQNIRQVLESFVSTIKLQLAQGNSVSISGLGKFDYIEYPSKKYYKPGQLDPIETKSSKIPRFKPSKDFKEILNK